MNARQKTYDSYEPTNKLLKITNSYYLYKNLEKIKNRKPQYGSSQGTKPKHKPNSNQVYKDYFVVKENLIIYNKIRDIMNKKKKPQTNNNYLARENLNKEIKIQYKNLEDMKLAEENKNFKKRLQNQRSSMSANEMEKEYKRGKKVCNTHVQAPSVVLPPVNLNRKEKIKKDDKKEVSKSKVCVTEANKNEE